jgi:dihydrofolate synthase/folylpolyglutamate synthase
MPRFTTINDVERYFLQYSPKKMSGESYTLERMRKLMKRLGNPQNSFKTIHVAGTSGKTSTAYFIRAMLHHSGRSVGLTASPHITSITERVQLGIAPMEDAEFIVEANEFIDTISQWPDIKPTYFELMIAFAYTVFAKTNVEYAVIEVGLGGMLDATNVVTRGDKVNVITPIGLDHTEVLGTTYDAIARQKAGIIQPNGVVFSAWQNDEAMKAIEEVAKAQHASLNVLEATISDEELPRYQHTNLALAVNVATYIAVRDGFRFDDRSAIDFAVCNTPPGRFEQLKFAGKTVLLDGAHNPQKLQALFASIGAYDTVDTCWLVGLIDAPEQKLRECAEILSRVKGDFVVTEFDTGQDMKSRRSVSAEYLAALLNTSGQHVATEKDLRKALDLALSSPGPYAVVTGSLYLVSRIRALLSATSL